MAKGIKAPKAGASRGKRGIQWYIDLHIDGKRKRRYFQTREARDTELRQLNATGEALRDRAIKGATQEDVIIARTVREALGGAGLTEMLDLWKRHRALSRCTVQKAAEDYLKTKEDAIERGNNHSLIAIDAFRAWLKGDARQINEISRKEIIAYFDALRKETCERTGARFTPTTIHNRHKILHAWFNHCRRRELITDNPVRDILLPEVDEKEIEILGVPDTFRLFHAAYHLDQGIARLLALGAFAGLRTESILKLEVQDIVLGEGINFPAKKFKTGTSHFATGLPDNLWKWIHDIAEAGCLGMKKREFEERRKRVAGEAKVTLPHNWARHSFATYFSALHGDVNKAAAVLGHRGTGMTWKHYKGRATEFEAKAYFGLSVLSIKQGMTPDIFAAMFHVLKKAMARKKLNAKLDSKEMVAFGTVKASDDSWARGVEAAEAMLLPLVDEDVADLYRKTNRTPYRLNIKPERTRAATLTRVSKKS